MNIELTGISIDKTDFFNEKVEHYIFNPSKIEAAEITETDIAIWFSGTSRRFERSKYPRLVSYLLGRRESDLLVDKIRCEPEKPKTSTAEETSAAAFRIFTENNPAPETPNDIYDARLGAFIRGFRKAEKFFKTVNRAISYEQIQLSQK